MCEPPYIQVGHGTQLSKLVLSSQNPDVWDLETKNFTVITKHLLQLHWLLEYSTDHASQAIWQWVLTNKERYKNPSKVGNFTLFW
jgi:hypothetical protein